MSRPSPLSELGIAGAAGRIWPRGVATCLACAAWIAWASPGAAGADNVAGVDGFTEPYRSIVVAAAEGGLLRGLLVKEGDRVAAGQVLATLDDELHQAQLALAKQQMEAAGRLRAAAAEHALHKRRHDKLAELQRQGAAHPEEVERARADLEVAAGRLLAEQEEQALHKLNHEKARLQLERRAVTAPVAGVVIEIHKQVGEQLTPSDARLLTLAELDPLRVVFLMPRAQASQLRVDQALPLVFQAGGQAAAARVEFISPVTDAESGLVTVKARLDNPTGVFHGGERCVWPGK